MIGACYLLGKYTVGLQTVLIIIIIIVHLQFATKELMHVKGTQLVFRQLVNLQYMQKLNY